MRSLMFFLLVFSSWSVQSQTLQPVVFDTQFEEKESLDNDTKWLIFSYNRSGGDWVKNAFDQLEIKKPQAHGWIYVSDISKMPSLITKIFALPKMRDYAFPMALDMEGDATKDWPRQEESVTVMQLDQLNVTKTEYFKDEKSLIDFLKTAK